MIRNPDDYRGIRISTETVKDNVIFIQDSRGKIKGKLIEKYVVHGERKVYAMGKNRKMIPAKTSSCSVRKYWFQLPDVKPSRLFWQKAIDRYHRHYWCDKAVLANQRFYPIYPREEKDEVLIACALNSGLTSLYLEFQRAAMGLGAIEATVDEVRQVPVIDPSAIAPGIQAKLADVLAKLGKSPVKTIFEELKNPDRIRMDDLILCSLGFENEEERKSVLAELYRELSDLAQMRVSKAKSVQKGKKANEGINLDLLAQNVLSRLGDNNLTTFFKERIATVPCYTLDLPKWADPIEIENSLLGWRLKIGKKAIDCSSEAQARYLRIFAEMGWDHVPAPQDDGYLPSIVDEWEKLFEEIQAVLEEHTLSILQRTVRERVTDAVWEKLKEEMMERQEVT